MFSFNHIIVLCVLGCLTETAFGQRACNQIPYSSGYSSSVTSYGGTGTGQVGVSGDIGASGQTVVVGAVPVLGSVEFEGCSPACGSVSISGQCGCGCQPEEIRLSSSTASTAALSGRGNVVAAQNIVQTASPQSVSSQNGGYPQIPCGSAALSGIGGMNSATLSQPQSSVSVSRSTGSYGGAGTGQVGVSSNIGASRSAGSYDGASSGQVGVSGNIGASRSAGSYGGAGTGQVGVSGNIGASGQTVVIGTVPVRGSVDFSGCSPSCGSVCISGLCDCESD